MRPLRVKTTVDATNWVKGLITEASPLNFPEGASVDEENFILNRDGTRRRRYGIGSAGGSAGVSTVQELGQVSFSVTASTTYSVMPHAIMTYLWENVGESPNRNLFVYQYGNQLYFYDANRANAVGNPRGTLSFTATTNAKFSFASIQGNLVVAVGDQQLRVVEWLASASYSVGQVRLKVRDFWGVDDGFATDERTSTLTDLHAYNLYNQGWVPEFFCSSDPDNPTTMNNGTVEDPVERTKLSLGVYPSNADILFTALTMLTNGRKAYYPHALKNIVSGNTPAANGHYIIDLFDRSQGRKDTYDEDLASGWPARRNYKTSIPTDQSTGGIKAVAAYAGRIFYACSAGETGGDSRSPHIGTFVLFSRLVDSKEDLAKCYQEADPTAEDISDLIDIDGGYIQLPDAVNIKALVPFKSELLVFADNGVWAIAGGDRGFTATEYQSKFLTNNGVLSPDSIVVTPDAVLYWSKNGIFALAVGQTGIEFKSLTEYTIQRLYNNIPYASKSSAVGIFDDASYRCRWLYQKEYNETSPQKFSHELILDLSMPAWSRFKFYDTANLSGTATPRLTGYLPTPVAYRNVVQSDFRYTGLLEKASRTYSMALYYFNDENFEDWSAVDAEAYLITGYVL